MGIEAYKRYTARKALFVLFMVAMLAAAVILSLMAGSSGLSFLDVVMAIFGRGTRQAVAIVWNVRMPRMAAGLVVGAALALCGCIMQNVLRNPLASASTLGVSQGASFGAALSIIALGAGVQVNTGSGSAAGLAITNPFSVSACAFAGGMVTTLVILAISRIRNSTPSSMILAGVAISSMFSGGTTLLQYFADDVMVASVVYWTFGSLSRAGWGEIGLIASLTSIAFLFFMLNSWNYNAMESGEETAKSLGVNSELLVAVSLVLAALITSISVAFVGCISFVGLIAPHMMRKFVGNDYRFLIPCSALAGAVIMEISDIACRMIVSPVVLPIGALTSFIGAPVFLYLIIKQGRLS